VIDLASGAEKKSEERRINQQKQSEKMRSDAEFNSTVEELKRSKTLIEELREKIGLLEQEKNRYQREYTAKAQINELIQIELDSLRGESDKLKQAKARLEVENDLLKNQIAFLSDVSILEKFFAKYGTVQREGYSLTVVLPENIWFDKTSKDLNECEIAVSLFVEKSDDDLELQNLANERAKTIKARLISMGADATRVKADGFTQNITQPKSKNAQNKISHRTEFTLRLLRLF
jgi:predicted RNase H-like nuclease (RuvC/YqgF family)